ncbi:hypothetical protein [Chryseobacterium sp. A321]
METYPTSVLSDHQKEALRNLWNTEYPSRLEFESLESVDRYLEGLSEARHYLLMESENIVGWAARFKREDRSWFAVILSKEVQGKAEGTKLLNLLKQKEQALYGWVIDGNEEVKKDGTFYRSPLEFYLKNDFVVLENERLELPTLSAVKIVWRAR